MSKISAIVRRDSQLTTKYQRVTLPCSRHLVQLGAHEQCGEHSSGNRLCVRNRSPSTADSVNRSTHVAQRAITTSFHKLGNSPQNIPVSDEPGTSRPPRSRSAVPGMYDRQWNSDLRRGREARLRAIFLDEDDQRHGIGIMDQQGDCAEARRRVAISKRLSVGQCCDLF